MDLSQWYGNDINLSPTGGVQLVSGAAETDQRLLRRLLTPPGAYLWHPTYGAGLGAWVGKDLGPADFDTLKALIIGQVLAEASVAQNPVPVVTLSDHQSYLSVTVEYVYAPTSQLQSLSFNVRS